MARTSSRLLKKKHNKLKNQTVKLVVVSVVIILLFVFVVMPGAVRLFFAILDGNSGLDVADDVPPQAPVISAPIDATFSAKIRIEGYGEPKSKTVFVLNSEELDRVDVNDEGKFEYDLMLEDGENKLLLYGVDDAENESVQTNTYNIVLDQEPPTIIFDELQDGQTIETAKNKNLTIRGVTEPKAKVMLNGRLVYAKSDGSFSTTINLVEGENKLEFEVYDVAGNMIREELTVNFKY